MHPSYIYQYSQRIHSFVPDVLPVDILKLSPRNVANILEKRYGHHFWKTMQYGEVFPSPVSQDVDSQWIKKENMVGINVRTIGNFWNIVKYAMTLPSSQSAIHILPIWECGVVASLYGMASWNINTEFFSHELYVAFPHLDTVEKQLLVVVNILHLMGKTVGMDVIPHTDRYSEVVLANPFLFEWLQRKDLEIINHSADLHKKIEQKIIDFIHLNGSAAQGQTFITALEKVFFSSQMPEKERLRILFGEKDNLGQRTSRRNKLIQYLYDDGYETVPATMGPPYRGIEVDTDGNAKTIDKDGRIWRDYKISKPQSFSRVFGPLARYKLYESKDDNKNWELDFDQPRQDVFHYVASKYLDVARTFGFDFMRGDMTHVQMRPDGVPKTVDSFYDIHRFIKHFIQKEKPWFAYFAESFLAPDGVMAYGSETEHLLQSDADTTLGDLQSSVVGSDEFLEKLTHYYDVLEKTPLSPNFTMMTADKDDPRFDIFYQKANELRYFVGIFIKNMPSYMSLGFECRDIHFSPAANENYTKLYVFQIDEGEKATKGSYQWGQNKTLFDRIVQMRKLSEWLLPEIVDKKIKWLQPTGKEKVLAWTFEKSPYTFVANLDTENEIKYNLKGEIIFSTFGEKPSANKLHAAECIILKN